MERTTAFEHVVRAALLTGLCIPLSTAMSLFAPAALTVHFLIGTLAFIFVLLLLRKGGMRTGRLTLAILAFSLLAAGSAAFGLRGFCLLAILVIWAVRSLLSYSSLLLSGADLALSLAAFSAAYWVLGASGSLLLAVWTFFLLQGFSSWLPKNFTPCEKKFAPETNDRFDRAYFSAEDALKRVIRAG